MKTKKIEREEKRAKNRFRERSYDSGMETGKCKKERVETQPHTLEQ
jgi:hypothetical protein